jgi:hypothetical protein
LRDQTGFTDAPKKRRGEAIAGLRAGAPTDSVRLNGFNFRESRKSIACAQLHEDHVQEWLANQG